MKTLEQVQKGQLGKAKEYLKLYTKSRYQRNKEQLYKAVRQASRLHYERLRQWGSFFKPLGGATVEVEASASPDEIKRELKRSGLLDVFWLSEADTKVVRQTPGTRIHNYAAYMQARTGLSIYTDLGMTCSWFFSKIAPREMRFYLLSWHGAGLLVEDCLVAVRKGQSISRAVLKALDTWSKPLPPEVGKEMRRRFEQFFSGAAGGDGNGGTTGMGHLWSARKAGYQLVMSCAPSTFLHMGTWQEKNASGSTSCYQPGQSSEGSKIWLMQIPKAVVIKIMKEGQDPKAKPAGRAWGFWFDGVGLIVSNVYGLTAEQFAPLVKAAVAAELGVSAVVVEADYGRALIEQLIRHTEGAVYTNGDTQLVAPNIAKLKKAVTETLAEMKAKTCKVCGAFSEAPLEACGGKCGHHVCGECMKEAHEPDGRVLRLCEHCLATMPKQECRHCNRTFRLPKRELACQTCKAWYCAECSERHDKTLELKNGECAFCRSEMEEKIAAMAKYEKRGKELWQTYRPGCFCADCQRAFAQAQAEAERAA